MRVLLLFLDGVGIGAKDPRRNPLFAADLPAMRSLSGGVLPSLRRRRHSSALTSLIPLNATLGVGGLPQSGTGQTALFTGANGPRIAGKHFGPFPYSTLRPVIQEHNLFRRLMELGKRPLFANAFPQRFFDYVEQHGNRLTVTTLSCRMAGLPLLRVGDLLEGRGVSADITNAGWAALGHPEVPVIEAREAGHRLVRLLKESDLVLYEYWKTDHAGHSGDVHEAIATLEAFDELLRGVLDAVRREDDVLLLMTSDHGNIEDGFTRSHTRNPVPLYIHGARHAEFARRMEGGSVRGPTLCGVTPVLVEMFRTASG